jgi:outer membrane cobalamin receptor
VEVGEVIFPSAHRADQLIAGIEHRLSRDVTLRVEAFRKHQPDPRPRFENMLNTLSILPELAPDRVRIAPSSVEMEGVELSAMRETAQWTQWGAISWSETSDEIDGAKIPRSWDQPWSLSLGAQWAEGPWRLGAAASVHQGWPITSLQIEPDSRIRLGSRNAARLRHYASLDVRAEYRRSLPRGTLALALELTNLLNRDNPCCVELISTDSAAEVAAITTDRLTWLPLLPSLSAQWAF